MPRYSKPRRSRLFYVRLWIVPALALVGIVAFFHEEFAFRREAKTSWIGVSATVEDTRSRPVARYALEYGSKSLYEVDILAAYAVDGVTHKEWIPLSERPKPLAVAQSEASAIKGKQCSVRWDPTAPDQKIAELH